MSLKVIPENSIAGNGIKKSQIIMLVENHHRQLGRINPAGNYAALQRNVDSRSILFSKDVIDQLFIENGLTAANSKEFGLRIYLGVHDIKNILTDIPVYNDKKEMVVLVVTRDSGNGPEDQLADLLNSVEVAGLPEVAAFGGGDGLDHGKICPPEKCGTI
ncbi:MAG: hypothetical protein V4456_07915 [Bacteroidota bacterium]